MKILITRPQPKADELKKLCLEANILAEVVPLLRIKPRPILSWLAELKDLPALQALIFVSPNAAQCFMDNHVYQQFQSIPCFAPGKSTADILLAHGFQHVIFPTHEENSEALLALPELQSVTGQHILIIRGTSGRELLADTLQARGAVSHYLAVYENSRNTLSPADIQRLNDDYDLVILTSTEALRYFLELRQTHAERITALPGMMSQLAEEFYPGKVISIASANNLYLLQLLKKM